MLLEEYEHNCVILVPARVEGNEGGWKTEWTDGETFVCRQALDTSNEVIKAEQEGLSVAYTGLVDKSCGLKYGDYFLDTETGLTYRVTSDPDDRQSPGSASFAFKYFMAERETPPE